MRFCVSVPVLSEQMMEALPSVSTAGRRRMMAFFFAMRCMPMESTTVTMAGRPSGMAETASDTLVMKISNTGILLSRPMTKITAQAARATMPNSLPMRASLCCSGVCVSSAPSSSPAMRPISVSMPVPVTMARPRP